MRRLLLLLATLLPAGPGAVAGTPPELPIPTEAEVSAAADLPVPPTNTHPTEWANPGSLGPTGLIAQRSLKALAYRILKVEAGSPAHGTILPGDVIVGIDGGRFQPEDYGGEHRSVERYSRYMEPNRALGRALEEVAARRQGRLVLTVRRGGAEGTAAVQLPDRVGFSATYPWNCAKSARVAEAIAARFAREKLPFRKDLYATVWYGLFLLNLDPAAHRATLDEIVRLVKDELPKIRSGSHLRGFGGGTWVWHTAAYGIFLSEYAMITGREKAMRPHLNLLADLLFDVRMVGNLWGHARWHNYGTMNGGFVSASSQAGQALLCLKRAGAAIHDSAMETVMDGLAASIRRSTGQVAYDSPDDGSARLPLDWPAIRKETSQLGVESLMRQGAVALAMHLDGRTDEARAASRFMERMIRCHATHGIAPDWGLFEAARAFAGTDPAACRRLLDTVRYRLNLCLRWDGGVQLVPYRNRRGEEYGVDTFRAERYVPAMWGLLLSMPRKRLFLLSKAVGPDATVKLPPSRERPPSDAIVARHLTCGGGRAYFAAPDGKNGWGVYEHDFGDKATRLLQGDLPKPPQELLTLKKKLYFSVPGATLRVWDGKEAREIQAVRKSRKAAGQFTPFNGAIYFVSPPSGRNGRGGELWKTDGTRAGTVKVRDGLWMLLGGSGAWQTDAAHAQSLQAALGRLFFVTCETDKGKPLYETTALWTSDGTASGTRKLATRKVEVTAVDNGNAPRGSYLGMEHDGKLYFRAGGRLWETDGTAGGTRECPLGVRTPNHFSRFRDRLVLCGRPVSSKKRRGRGGNDLELILTDGTPAGTRRFAPGVRQLRQITAAGDARFFFVGDDGRTGAELWTSEGTPETTRRVREIRPGPCGGVLDNLVALKGRLYFTAGDDAHGSELWCSDGTADGTRVADLLPGPAGSLPGQLRVGGGALIFHTTAACDGRRIRRLDPSKPEPPFRRP
jgi:ELWxxDGT repeat protein